MTDWATGFLRASGGGVRPDRSELAQDVEGELQPVEDRGNRALHLAAVDIVIVWATIIWLALAIWQHYRWIVVAQVPYFVWVSIAMVIQLSITIINWGR